MKHQIERIDELRKARSLAKDEFERLIHEALDAEMPFSVLPNVTLFRPDQFRTDLVEHEDAENPKINHGANPLAYEMDNLFHFRRNEVDHIVIVEAKDQPIKERNNEWWCKYKTGHKPIRKQLLNHASTVVGYLKPIGRNAELRIHGILVSSDPETEPVGVKYGDDIFLEKCSYTQLPAKIRSLLGGPSSRGGPAQLLRIAQSEYMTLLRLGIPVKSLGHPELRHAIHYVNRCKRYIDHELYRGFKPSKRRWAINGTAGMGKSVLLAYGTAVFACNHQFDDEEKDLKLKEFEARAESLGLNKPAERSICAFAMKPKQLDVLKSMYESFVRDLSDQTPNGDLIFVKPKFDVWMDEKGIPEGCNVLVIDESHDLSDTGQDLVRSWHEASPQHYLMLACDRHQKIRLTDPNATIIKGLSFSGFSKKLGRNYRNPFPVYAASLALMFRWFADTGVKVIPNKTELKDLLGSGTEAEFGEELTLSLRNDSHPSNLWSHSVGNFRSCSAAFSHLAEQNLKDSEVLWVRFAKEDADFNYERLNCFTYHNFFTSESADLVDKYVKGQEFPIVVIEGFPDFMDPESVFSQVGKDTTNPERKMWSFRRQLYICASRATAFLYFIPRGAETDPFKRIKNEVSNLVESLSTCVEPTKAGSKEWRFVVKKPTTIRRIAVFDDLAEIVEEVLPSQESVPEPTGSLLTINQSEHKPVSKTVVEANKIVTVGTKQPAEPQTKPTRVPALVPARRQVTVQSPIVVSELAAALGLTIPRIISEFNGLKRWPNAMAIVTLAEAQELADLFSTDLQVSKPS
jgi:hypothetical protein